MSRDLSYKLELDQVVLLVWGLHFLGLKASVKME